MNTPTSSSAPPRMPLLFVGHGNPMHAIEESATAQLWHEMSQTLPKPKAILCISAHWETRGVAVTASPKPVTIHDFGGFPQALFDVLYPAPGDPALAQKIQSLIHTCDVQLDANRGLDHGAWCILRRLFPLADVPIVQVSLAVGQGGQFHFDLAKQLAPLRDEGVMIIASGNVVHNLRDFDFRNPRPQDWAIRADALIRSKVQAVQFDDLIHWPSLGSDMARAIPTEEHFLPLLYALALSTPDDRLEIFNPTVESAISMTSFMWTPRTQ